ncbi:transmembrane protein C5orf28-like isoform X2, partial [Dinothrombium tinctorium]
MKLILLTVAGFMLFVASSTHHLRDGLRRGLWLYPFANTPPLNPILYFASLF